MNSNKCTSCNAELPVLGFFCEHCGTPIPDRIKVIDTGKTWDENRQVITNNLDALYDIPKPSVKDAILTVLWWYVAILTLGIATIWWKKPKTFNLQFYDKITNVINRNIVSLKSLAGNDDALLQQVQPLETEFRKLTTDFREKIKIKRIATIISIIVFLAFIIFAQIDSRRNKTPTGLKEDSIPEIQLEILSQKESGTYTKSTELSYRITNKSKNRIHTIEILIQALDENNKSIGDETTYDINIDANASESGKKTFSNLDLSKIKKWKARINKLLLYPDWNNDYSNSYQLKLIEP